MKNFILIFVISLFPQIAFSQDIPPIVVPISPYHSLCGINELSIVILGKTEELENMGLSINQIKTDIESKLRLLDIKISNHINSKEKVLVANINFLKVSNGLIIWGIELRFFQYVLLYHNVKADSLKTEIEYDLYEDFDLIIIVHNVPTWSNTYLGYTLDINDIKLVREKINYLTDMFCKDYLKANPKK